MIRTLLTEAAQALRLAPPLLNAQGACALEVPPGVRVEIHVSTVTDSLCFVSALGPNAHHEPTQALRRLLCANLARGRAGEPTFALAPASGDLLMTRSIGLAGCDAASLAIALRTFTSSYQHTRSELVHSGVLAP